MSATKRVTAALTRTEGNVPVVYLFKGTWAARYTLVSRTWQLTEPFRVARHLSTWWPGLAATAGRKAYDAVWEESESQSDRLWLTARNRVIRYDLAKGQLVEQEGELSGLIADLPNSFDKGVDAAMNTADRVYLFKGSQYCTYKIGENTVTGGAKKLGTDISMDAVCLVNGTPHFFSGEYYYTGTINPGDNSLTLNAASKKKITDTWPGAPLAKPTLDIYCNPGGKLTRLRTNIDLFSGESSLPSNLTSTATALNFPWTKHHFPPPFFYVTPDNRRAYVPDRDGEQVVAVDLTMGPSEDPVIWKAKLSGPPYTSAMAPDWGNLWMQAHPMQVSKLTRLPLDGGTTAPTPTYEPFKNMYRALAVSPDCRTVYVGFFRGENKVEYEFAMVDAKTLKYSTTVYLGELKPDYIAASPDRKRVFVGTTDKPTVTRVDLAKPTEPKRFSAGGRVVGLAVSPDGQRGVAAVNTNRGVQKVMIVPVTGDYQTDIPIGGAKSVSAVAVDPNSRFAYVSDAEAHKIWVVDMDQTSVAGSIDVSGVNDLYHLALAPRWE